jgi:hypothetical protein
MSVNGFNNFSLGKFAGLIDELAMLASPSGAGATASAAASVTSNGGLRTTADGGVQTWRTITASAAAATATAGGATATATAGAGAAAGAGGVTGGQPAAGVGQSNLDRAVDALTNFITGFAQGLLEGLAKAFCPTPPNPADGGGLKADAASASVTTSGGYKIEPLGQFEWKITGPDGKDTRIWGDPHVAEKDGGKWDFKKDSTFVLPDGTKIHCKTTPWGNGDMTVTQSLQIENNGQVVDITGIDKGKGQVGQVRQGQATVQTQQTFVMGKESDDWSFQGKEILGDNGADNFKLGNALEPGRVGGQAAAAAGGGGAAGGTQGAGGTQAAGGGQAAQGTGGTQAAPAQNAIQHGAGLERSGQMLNILQSVLGVLGQLVNLLKDLKGAGGAYANPEPQPAKTTPPYNPDNHRAGLANAFRNIGTMFTTLANVLDLVNSVKPQGALKA